MNQSFAPRSENEAALASPASLFAILYRPGPNWIETKSIKEQPLGSHCAYMEKLFATGQLVVAGPFLDGGEFAVIRAADDAGACAILTADPAITSGLFVGEVRPWYLLFDCARELRERVDLAERNVAVLRHVFAAVSERGTGDPATAWAAYQSAYDPDVVIYEAPTLPYGGSYTGPEAVARHAQGFNETWQGLQSEEERALEPQFFPDGNRVAVLWRHRAHNPQTGEQFDMPAMSIYTMRNGRIVESRMFHFDAGAVRDFLTLADRVEMRTETSPLAEEVGLRLTRSSG